MEELFEGILNHHLGFVVWSTLAFLVLLALLRKFAWKPILSSIYERERSIENALESAEKAKNEMARLTNENELLLKQARTERDLILKEAKELKEQIIHDAKASAQAEGSKILEKARHDIEVQKATALNEVKNQVSALSLEIAEKILRKQLTEPGKQEALISDLIKDVKLN